MCHQNHTHKILHSSAIYKQNLNKIHEPSKKLLTMKSVKKKINTYNVAEPKNNASSHPYQVETLPVIRN